MYVPPLSLMGPQPAAASSLQNPALYDNAGSKTYASDLYATLTRQQWADVMRLQGPLQDKLVEFATDTAAPTAAMGVAAANVNSAFDQQAQSTQRRLRGLGLTLDADEQASATRSLDLARGLASVGAQNAARDRVRARQLSILGTAMPNVGGM